MGIFLGEREQRAVPFFAEPPLPAFPGANTGRHASLRSRPDMALTIPTVWACVTLLAGTVSSLPLETFRRTSDTPMKITSPPLVDSPSEGMTQSQWVHMLMMSLLLRGNGIGIKSQFSQLLLRPGQIDLVDPDMLDIKQSPDTGDLEFRYKNRPETVIDPSTVWLLPGLTMPGRKLGLTPLTYAAATLGIDLSARGFATEFFDGGGIPKAILKSDQTVTQEQAKTIKDRLMGAFRTREPIVLGAGLDYQMISVKPEESQFLKTMEANVAQIARFFGIPPEMVGGSGGHSMTYANVEQRSLDFVTYTLAPWLKRIEDAISALLPLNVYVKFRTEDLIRLDAHTRAQVEALRIAARVLTPTEVREMMGRPPMTDAQKSEADIVPLGIGPLGRPVGLPGLNQPPLPTAPPGPPAITPPSDQLGGPNG